MGTAYYSKHYSNDNGNVYLHVWSDNDYCTLCVKKVTANFPKSFLPEFIKAYNLSLVTITHFSTLGIREYNIYDGYRIY